MLLPYEIRLYHGSLSSVKKPLASKGSPFRDFGRGFYAAWDPDQAIAMAKRGGGGAE
jgi:hypothetical protein